MKTSLAEIPPFVTRDGSTIRELMHPSRHGNRSQSLAQATVAPGQSTRLHRHRCTEELYHILSGRGQMTLGEAQLALSPGDTVCIPPGTPHCLNNTGTEPLVLLCACAPAYSHDDTELLQGSD